MLLAANPHAPPLVGNQQLALAGVKVEFISWM
jgi:hypothetical protein